MDAAKLILEALKSARLSREMAITLLRAKAAPLSARLACEQGVERAAASCALVLFGEEFCVRDHRVAGACVLPGVAYLELARIAVERVTGARVCELRDVLWTQPMVFADEPCLVFIRTTPRDGATVAWEIASESASVHARGICVLGDARTVERGESPTRIAERCAIEADVEACYRRFAALGLQYGPTYRAIKTLRCGEDEALSEIQRAASASQLDEIELHSGLLDGALQSSLGLELGARGTNGASKLMLPFGIDQLTLHAPLSATVYAHVLRRPGVADGGRVRKLDIGIVNADGRRLISIKGFTAVSVPQASSVSEPRRGAQRPVYARVTWPSRQMRLGRPSGSGLLIVDAGLSSTAALRSSFPEMTVCVVGAGLREDFTQTLERVRSIDSGTSVVVVSGPTARLRCAAFGGLFKSAYREGVLRRAKLVEWLTRPESSELVENVAREVSSVGEGVEHVRYTEQGRYVRAVELVELDSSALPFSINGGAVIWITGGLGGLGGLFAEHLGTRHGARIILSGRSDLRGTNAERLQRLRSKNVEVEYIACDASDRAQATRTVEQIVGRYGALHGVVHAAGVLRDARITNKTASQIGDVFRSKVDVVLALDEATANQPLEFFAMFSSLSGELGNVGQADYAGANAFLDEFAVLREQRVREGSRRGRTLSIGWPLWRDGGMNVDAGTLQMIERLGFSPLETQAGLDAFERLLAGAETHVLVAAGDRARIAAQFEPQRVEPKRADAASGIAAQFEPQRVEPKRADAPNREASLLVELTDMVAKVLKLDARELDVRAPLGDFGIDSLGYVSFADAIQAKYGVELAPTQLFEHRTLVALARLILPLIASEPARSTESPQPQPAAERELVAVVGMCGRFPGARSLDLFWENLVACRDSITDAPSERTYWHERLRQQPEFLRRGGFLDGVDEFDPLFFNISPREAMLMDPQHRLFMQAVWGAIEHSGHAPSELAGSDTAVFVGVANQDYWELLQAQGADSEGQSTTGISHAMLANRISFLLDLRGPSHPIDTACSSSLVAIHRAVRGIESGEFAMAIAGGVNVLLAPSASISFARAGMLSPEGLCKTFDARADGYVRGEGVGAIVLKRLSHAVRDRDTIYGVIRASAENHGGRANSLTAPNPAAQRDLLVSAYSGAGVDPRSVGYIETHGTGTALGDPIEIDALRGAFDALYAERGLEVRTAHCVLGAVKSNIGHLETAAGIAGVLKVLLALRHKKRPGLVHLRHPNRYLKLDGSPMQLARETSDWPAPSDQFGVAEPRRAGVSSFGFGGANAHIVFEEYDRLPSTLAGDAAAEPQLIVLSARTSEQLVEYARSLAHSLRSESPALRDVAYTLQVGRNPMPERLAFVAADSEELSATLDRFCRGNLQHVRRGSVGRKSVDRFHADARSLVQQRSLDLLADVWVKGTEIEFELLHSEPLPRRVALPTYPFAVETYWPPGPGSLARSAAPRSPTPSRLVEFVADHLKLSPDRIDPEARLEKIGIDSVMIVSLTAALEDVFGPLPKTLFFEHQTLASLAAHLAESHADRWGEWAGTGDVEAAPPMVVSSPPIAVGAARERDSAECATNEPIAIIGVSGRYPRADDLDEFWENLKAGLDCVEDIPRERWDNTRYYEADREIPGRIHAKAGGFLRGVDRFDPSFFSISPREAEVMDPQERLFLETAWATLEDAGYTREALQRVGGADADVGVFVGVMYEEYQLYGVEETSRGNVRALSGNAASIANRVSYFCGFGGPSLAVDTMCSSSLTSIHLACQSIRAGECALAIAGGVNVSVHPNKYIALSQGRFLSSKGRCESFAAGGDGYIPAEGVGAVLLKPLSRAIADGDRVYGVIRGSALNHGGKTNGYTVPNPRAQTTLLRRALDRAGVDPRAISYVEAHGTGTSLGDPIEVASLSKAFGERTSERQYCAIGSVKSNIGHAESAAGIAGLTKVLLQLQHRTLVPSIHAEQINPNLDFSQTPFVLQRRCEPWLVESGLRIAGISAFGAGGSNAHVVVSEFVSGPEEAQPAPAWSLLPLSAKSPDRLTQYAEKLLRWLQKQPVRAREDDLRFVADLAFTFQVGREAMEHRSAFVVSGAADLIRQLSAFAGSATRTAGGPVELIDAASRWQKGERIDWRALSVGNGRRRIAAPTYPFARQRHWYDSYQANRASKPLSAAEPYDGHEVQLEVVEGGIALVRMEDRESRNMFTPRFISGLQARLREAQARDEVKVVVLTGYERVFCMGGSQEGLLAIAERRATFADVPFLFRGLLELDIPVISAVQGHAFGGGFLFGLYADVILLAEQGVYSANFMDFGFTPGMGATYILGARLGQALATEMMYTARRFSGAELRQRAAPVLVRPDADVLSEALAIARQLAKKPRRALSVLKRELSGRILQELVPAIARELEMHEKTFNGAAVTDEIRRVFEAAEPTAPVAAQTAEGRTRVQLDAVVEQKVSPKPAAPVAIRARSASTGTLERIRTLLAEVLHLEPHEIDTSQDFADLGLDSIAAVELLRDVRKAIGVELHASALYDAPTLDALASLIDSHEESAAETPASEPMPPAATGETQKDGGEDIGVPPPTPDDGIAVIGMSARVPGATDVNAFWQNVVSGQSSLAAVPRTRWADWGIEDAQLDEALSRSGCLDSIDRFDPLFFSISPREADAMDPQQRLFLQEAWHAVEDAGYAPRGLSERECGVFVGVAQSDYGATSAPAHPHVVTGNLASLVASRVAYAMDLSGPCMTVDTACSSSLTAIHLACESLRRGECDLALAGGVYAMSTANCARAMYALGLLSKSCHCRPFDANADGWVLGEAVGAIVLKPLRKAIEDRDSIYAVIRASGVNQSGRSQGVGAPRMDAQAALQTRVHREAGIDPTTIDYVEVQGVANRAGDAAEFAGLTSSFASGEQRSARCALGTLKPNVGHALTASGIASTIKVLLAFRARTIPPLIGVEQPNPDLGLEHSPFYFPRASVAWTRHGDRPRRAAVHGFGFSGTNAYLVFEEGPGSSNEATAPGLEHVVPLSASSPEQLGVLARRLNEFLGGGGVSLRDLACTLQMGRVAMKHRVAFVVKSVSELSEQLDAYVAGRAAEFITGVVDASSRSANSSTHVESGTARELADLFCAGANIAWQKVHAGVTFRRLHLPTYPFAEKRCWTAPPVPTSTPSAEAPPPAKSDGAVAPVIEVISRLVGISPRELDPARPLVEYGMDSFLFVRFVAEMQAVSSSAPGLERIRTCTTTSDLIELFRSVRLHNGSARKLVSTPSFPELVRLNDVSQGRPVFWLHSGLGGVELYRALSTFIERPFYGIEARGFMSDRVPLVGIQAMAAYYVHIILNTQPDGPYDLGGYSLGGMLAYEVARQMQELGKRVDRIVMVDALDTTVFRKVRLSDKTEAFHALNIALQSEHSARADELPAVLVHCDQVDRTLEGDDFVRHLIEVSRARNLRKNSAQLERLIHQHVRVQKAFKDDAYRVLPLPSPESIACHFLRNRAGRFLGTLEPYFLLDPEEITLDGVNYWSEWEAVFPRFQCVDVEADNHMVMLSEPAALQQIGEYCKGLYGKSPLHDVASERPSQVRERRRERTKLLQLD